MELVEIKKAMIGDGWVLFSEFGKGGFVFDFSLAGMHRLGFYVVAAGFVGGKDDVLGRDVVIAGDADAVFVVLVKVVGALDVFVEAVFGFGGF